MSRTAIALSLLIVSAASAAANGPAGALLELPSGITLHYAVQGRADGEPLVLLHGVGDSWRSWELALPHFPDRFRVYALSLRGHGWSDAPETGYSQQDFAADVRGFLEAMNLRNVTLVGHSMGSFVAQAVAVQETSRLKALVLVGSGPGGAQGAEAEVRGAFDAMRVNPRFARDFQGSMFTRPVPAAFLEEMIEAAAGVPSHAWAQLGSVIHSPQTEAGLASIRVPTLLIWGDRDALVTRKDQDALLARIRGSRLIAYSDVGHTPHWEEPARLAADVVGFIPR